MKVLLDENFPLRLFTRLNAVPDFLKDVPMGQLFELTPDGAVAPLNIRPPK